MESVAVIGAGSWGTALSVVLAENCRQVTLWARREELCREVRERRENTYYLPGVQLPKNVAVTSDLAEAVSGRDALVLVVPSHTVRTIARVIAPQLTNRPIVVNCAKGIEEETYCRMSEILAQELPQCEPAVLSGPNHAEEVGRRVPSATVVSAKKRVVAEAVQDLFMTHRLRVYTNPDMVGVELGGALKNVIALAAGISDGLGYGDNTKAAIVTRGLSEIGRLGLRMGAEALTFAGLAGIGDLMVTCMSAHSRNRKLGLELGRGRKLSAILPGMRMVAEGVRTTRAALQLGRKYGVDLPITEQVHEVLFKEKNPHRAVVDLLKREKTHEMEEVVASRLKNW
ncbi:MAG TPA: NAD(P)H-dependent glycerol-3-phosphate dehydrogenase [Firmicutes bacterium]|nr:NAD(P)H-dependent glycerol-3-phosphate dehydrogenase [Bacillota bacterium]